MVAMASSEWGWPLCISTVSLPVPLSCSCPFSYSINSLSCFNAMPRAVPDPALSEKLKDWVGQRIGGNKRVAMGTNLNPSQIHWSIPLCGKKRQEFYDDYLMQDNYKVKRFHALAKERGVPANLVSHALERKKARLVSIKPSSKVGNCNMRLLSFIIGIRLFVAHLAAPNQICFLAPWEKSLPLAGSAHLFLCQSAVHWDKLYFGWCLGAQVFTALAVQLIMKQKELDTYGFIDSYVLKYILAPFGKPFGP